MNSPRDPAHGKSGHEIAEPCICTIAAENYVHYVRTLAKSFRQHHSDGKMFFLLIDSDCRKFKDTESFTTISITEIGIPNLFDMILSYDIVELCTAAKPYFLEYLLEHYSLECIVYLDPDIYVYRRLDELWRALAVSPILLTPHLTKPLVSDLTPNEETFLNYGVYNLGFIGLSAHPASFRMLQWWKSKLATRCLRQLDKGLFVDQRWMDLAPACFEETMIFRDPTYNVAYWNLHERKLSGGEDQFKVNGRPLGFFHFSGFDPLRPNSVSKHQNRYSFSTLPFQVRQLFSDYRQALEEEGLNDTINLPGILKFDATAGKKAEAIRYAFRFLHLEHSLELPGDLPNSTPSRNRLLRWLSEPVTLSGQETCISRTAYALQKNSRLIQLLFSHIENEDMIPYAIWFVFRSRHRLDMPWIFIRNSIYLLTMFFIRHPIYTTKGIIKTSIIAYSLKNGSHPILQERGQLKY